MLNQLPSPANTHTVPTRRSRAAAVRPVARRSDADLAAASAAGDSAAFVELAGRYRWLIDRLARTYWLPGCDENDLRQEALLGLLNACRGYEPGRGAFVGFAKLCTERLVMTAVKTATRHKHWLLTGAMSLDAPPPGTDLDGATLGDLVVGGRDPYDEVVAAGRRREFAARAGKLASRLSDVERTALQARLDGVSYADTAARLGVSVKRVDNALRRARLKAAAAFQLEAAAS